MCFLSMEKSLMSLYDSNNKITLFQNVCLIEDFIWTCITIIYIYIYLFAFHFFNNFNTVVIVVETNMFPSFNCNLIRFYWREMLSAYENVFKLCTYIMILIAY